MSDYRRPTDGELFRKYRPGAGQPSPPPQRGGSKWRSPGLKGDHAAVFSLARTALDDEHAATFVCDLARWLNKPHGLAGQPRVPARSTTDQALRKLLYGMSPGEAEFHLKKLQRAADERRRGGLPTRALDAARAVPSPSAPAETSSDPNDEPNSHAADLASFLAAEVPKPEAIEIVHLIARDVGVEPPSDLHSAFYGATARFADKHLSEARAATFLERLKARRAQGASWIDPTKRQPPASR